MVLEPLPRSPTGATNKQDIVWKSCPDIEVPPRKDFFLLGVCVYVCAHTHVLCTHAHILVVEARGQLQVPYLRHHLWSGQQLT